MNRKYVYIIIAVFFALVCSYTAFCLRPYYTNADVELLVPIPPEAEATIRQWNKETTEIPRPTMTAQGIWYALTHPYLPSDERCWVTNYSEGVIVIQMTYDASFTAIFYNDDGNWIYDKEGSHEVMKLSE